MPASVRSGNGFAPQIWWIISDAYKKAKLRNVRNSYVLSNQRPCISYVNLQGGWGQNSRQIAWPNILRLINHWFQKSFDVLNN